MEKKQYQSPSVKVMEIRTRNHILTVSQETCVSAKDWDYGSESTGSFGDK